MTTTTRLWRSLGYMRPTCRRCAAKASCIRRFWLGGPAFFFPAGHSSVVAWTAAVVRLRTARTSSRPLLSLVPTSGRCPLTPNVGTNGRRASSWLSKTSSSLSAPL